MDLKQVACGQLSSNPFRPRQSFDQDKLLSLATSFRRYGVLTPLLVAKTPAGLQIIAGERRWRAAKMAGINEIPCVMIEDLSPVDLALLSLSENLLSEPLNLLDQAGILQKLVQESKMSTAGVAERLGIKEAIIEQILGVLDLPDNIQSSYLQGEIRDADFLRLAQIGDPIALLEEFNNLREPPNQTLA